MSETKPAIKCASGGPYLIKADDDSAVVLGVQTADGESVETVGSAALCRCGGSKNKPYCDGSHKHNGFSDAREADGSDDRRLSYVGARITIHDNRGICAHAGYCTDNLKSVFRMGEEPWIDPDGASAEAIVDVIKQCPSGALSYSIDGEEFRHPEREAKIRVLKNGPYMVSGVALAEHELGDGVSEGRYTLCRCGASKNKPFCDGSHWDIGFDDGAD